VTPLTGGSEELLKFRSWNLDFGDNRRGRDRQLWCRKYCSFRYLGVKANFSCCSRRLAANAPNGGPFRTRTGTAGLGNLSSILLS
jgi:hypothetical protein